jgi:hypothetical protein
LFSGQAKRRHQQKIIMSIPKESELIGMKKVSDAVDYALKEMKNFARPGIRAQELDDFGANILKNFGANQTVEAVSSNARLNKKRSSDGLFLMKTQTVPI